MEKINLKEKILKSQLAIESVLSNPDLLEKFKSYGYDEKKFNEGKSVYLKVLELMNGENQDYFDPNLEDANKLKDLADLEFNKTFELARIAFRNNFRAQSLLMLKNPKKVELSEWILQAEYFYRNLTSEEYNFSDALAQFGYDRQKIKKEYDLILQVAQANLKQEKVKNLPKEIASEKEKKIEEMEQWLNNFKETAKIALSDKNYLLKNLGIIS